MAKKAAANKPIRKSRGTVADRSDDARTIAAMQAKLKQLQGGKLTQTESRDLVWYESNQLDRLRHQILTSVPKGVFCAMAARQQKVLDEQAERYDLPIDTPEIDLYLAIKAYHDLISANHRYLRPADDAEMDEDFDSSTALHHQLQTEKLRQEVLKLQQSNERLAIAVNRDRGDSIDRKELRQMLTWLSSRLEGLGQQLRRSSGGPDAQKTLNDFLKDLAKECDQGVLRV